MASSEFLRVAVYVRALLGLRHRPEFRSPRVGSVAYIAASTRAQAGAAVPERGAGETGVRTR
jgi:hypothetical protein